MSTPAPGRRAARVERRRRLEPTTVVALGLVLLVGLALWLVRPDAAARDERAPERTPLTAASVICPSALDGRQATVTDLGVTSAASDTAAGSITLTSPAGESSLEVAAGRVSEAAAQDAPVVVRGSGELAPGLVAGISSAQPLTAFDCAPARAEHWFTGVGAGPTHASVLELVNPNDGPAVVDVEVLSEDGPIEVGSLRGIRVDGNGSQQLDLGQVVPRTGVMALHATVVRGELGIAVRDRGERLTGGVTTEDWLPSQAAPARETLLLGLRPGGGRHTLSVANAGDTQVQATVRLVTPDSVLSPAGLEPIDVAPDSVAQTWLDDVLAAADYADAIGVLVEASGPVTTSLRSVVDGDLAVLTPGETVSTASTVVVPQGAKTLALGGASAVGVATVVARDAAGEVLAEERLSLAPEKGAALELPEAAVSVTVTPDRTVLQGAVLASGGGLAVVRLRELARTSAVPDVAPGLP